MPRFRKMIDVSIPFVGIAIVFLAVILISDFNLQARVLTVLVGILFIQAGVWKLTTRFLPSARDSRSLLSPPWSNTSRRRTARRA